MGPVLASRSPGPNRWRQGVHDRQTRDIADHGSKRRRLINPVRDSPRQHPRHWHKRSRRCGEPLCHVQRQKPSRPLGSAIFQIVHEACRGTGVIEHGLYEHRSSQPTGCEPQGLGTRGAQRTSSRWHSTRKAEHPSNVSTEGDESRITDYGSRITDHRSPRSEIRSPTSERQRAIHLPSGSDSDRSDFRQRANPE